MTDAACGVARSRFSVKGSEAWTRSWNAFARSRCLVFEYGRCRVLAVFRRLKELIRDRAGPCAALYIGLSACGASSAEVTNVWPERSFPGSGWVDQTHSNLEERIQRTAVWLDSRFGDAGVMTGRCAACTAMIGAEVLVEDGGAIATRVRGRASFDLPRMERRLRIFIDNFKNDMLPGVDPLEGERELKIGTHWRLLKTVSSLFDLDVGVRARLPPEAFARLRYRYAMGLGEWTLHYDQTEFWTVDDHLGELSAFTFTRPFGSAFLFRSVTAGRFSQNSEGFETEQTLGLGVQFAGGRRQLDLSGSVFAERDDIVNYRVRLGWRARWLRGWNTFYVVPELQFPVDEGMEPKPSVRIGLETVYW